MTKPIHCLVLEREENIVLLLRKAVAPPELLVSRVAREHEVLKRITASTSIDILFLDAQALEQEELPFLEKIRQLAPNTLLMVANDIPFLPTVVSAIRSGTFDYLAKPVRPERIVSAMRAAIEQVKSFRLKKKMRDITNVWQQDEIIETNADKINEELVQSEKLAYLGESAAEIAHEINTPLTGIVGFIGLFLRFLDKPGASLKELLKVRHYLTNARGEAIRCREILDNILSFSRKETQEFENFSLIDVLKRVRSIVGKQLERANIDLIVDIPDEIPSIRGNANQIQQVFINLLVNAKRAMPKGGTLQVKIQILQNQLQISVSDTGVGIPKDRLEKIFEPFYTTNEKGTGLGLSITRKIVQEHGGDIIVDSEVDKGTTFTLLLPS